jgi:hypothetical protein
LEKRIKKKVRKKKRRKVSLLFTPGLDSPLVHGIIVHSGGVRANWRKDVLALWCIELSHEVQIW